MLSRLRLEGVSLTSAKGLQPMLSDVSMALDAGDVLSVFGRSGSGKTTLLLARALGRDDPRISGDVTFGFRGSSPGRLGVVFDDANWSFCNLRVDEELAFVLENGACAPNDMIVQVKKTLTRVGLEGFESRRISTLSGGELRKLAVGTVLIGKPDVILSDDLDASLDPTAVDSLNSLIETYVAATGAAWLDFSRRWTGFGTPDRSFATLTNGHVTTFTDPASQRAKAEQGIADAVGPPLGLHLRRLIGSGTSPQTESNRSPFYSAREAVEYLRASGCRLVSNAEQAIAYRAVIGAKGLSFSYSERGMVLRDCSIELESGVVQVLAGKNGVGKTTLARILCGLLPPDSGRFFLNGRHASRSDMLRAGSLVFQNPEYQFITDSVRTEIQSALDQAAQTSIPARNAKSAEAVLRELGLAHRAHEHPFNLTLGEKRRLAVGAALAQGGEFLIIDEPTLGQDAFQTRALGNQLRMAAREGTAILVITHDAEFITTFGDRVLLMEDGKVTQMGEPQSAFSRSDSILFYGRSHLLTFWELATSAGVASGPAPHDLADIALQR
jgi:energy-coupling factor transporter ATP-binding protein EcfA2